MMRSGYWHDLTTTDFAGLDPERTVALLPVSATEQHGPHLPLSTDAVINEAVVRGALAQVPATAVLLVLPPVPVGDSLEHTAFRGTLSARLESLLGLWLDIGAGVARAGVRKLVVFNTHGGQQAHVDLVAVRLRAAHRMLVVRANSSRLGKPPGLFDADELAHGLHGGQLETSLMLHLRPDLVHMERVIDETDFVTSPCYYMDWIEGGALVANPPWDDDTKTGAYGAGSLARAEHGKLWLEAAIAEKVAHVLAIDDQHRRREERRSGGYGLWGKR